MIPTSNFATVLGTELHYMECGAGHAGTVIAWHGSWDRLDRYCRFRPARGH